MTTTNRFLQIFASFKPSSYRKISFVIFHPADHDITANHLPRATREPKSNPSRGGRFQCKRNGFSVPINGPKQFDLLRCVQNCIVSVLREQICRKGAVKRCEANKREQRKSHNCCVFSSCNINSLPKKGFT